MALASLRYDAGKDVTETKAGFFIYDGNPQTFHEWEFRVGIRWESTESDQKKKTMSQIIEALGGEAAQVAMDIGMEELMKIGEGTNNIGYNKLLTEMRLLVFPFARAEVKTLYKAGHKTKGALSRQPNEPMVSYV